MAGLKSRPFVMQLWIGLSALGFRSTVTQGFALGCDGSGRWPWVVLEWAIAIQVCGEDYLLKSTVGATALLGLPLKYSSR